MLLEPTAVAFSIARSTEKSAEVTRATGAPLHANYGLKNATAIESLNDVAELENSIFCFDEIWLSADARAWKDNVRLTQWVNQTRKKKMVVFYTTQHIRQVEMRIRNGTDVLIFCDKRPEGHWLTFMDWQYRTIGKRFLIENAYRFYDLYDTYQVLKPLNWDKKSASNSYKKKREKQPYENF